MHRRVEEQVPSSVRLYNLQSAVPDATLIQPLCVPQNCEDPSNEVKIEVEKYKESGKARERNITK